ncbi:LDLR chaperone boca-like [Panonychus citri]|uniref:LDLR chaperone boca-like n=1 Tax=Panonychus citri TaxID=50023 RepID=UPI0023072212|nr:LDLR chaperone boca-like [Panonychus citri]
MQPDGEKTLIGLKVKKDLRDYNDVDIEKIFEQWEEKDDPLEPDEVPEWKREPPKVDFSAFNFNNPEDVLKASKKGKSLMVFVNVYGKETRPETDQVTSLWQTSLMNNHILAERFIIEDNRAIFMFKDGAQAWDAKDFLIDQEFCDSVTIENKPYWGKFSPNKKDEL